MQIVNARTDVEWRIYLDWFAGLLVWDGPLVDEEVLVLDLTDRQSKR